MVTAVYLLVALLNSSVVQSYLGAAAGAYFSREWGGKVRIGALHFSPISHIILNDIELVSPTNDTIFDGERITCRFRQFPFHGGGLRFEWVHLKNSKYHFESIQYPSGKLGTNLDFIINYFSTGEPFVPDPNAPPFVVEVGELLLDGVDYHQDLPEIPGVVDVLSVYGNQDSVGLRPVSIPHMRWNNVHGRIKAIRVANDDVHCRFMNFSTLEASGLHVANLVMTVHVSPHEISVQNMDLTTDDSHLMCDVLMTYDGWESMADYCHNVHHDLVLKPGTEVDLREAAWWAPPLWGLRCRVKPQGHCYGTVDNLRAEHFVAEIAEGGYLSLDGGIAGLPDMSITTVDATLHRLHASYDDFVAITLPGADNRDNKLLAVLKEMAWLDMNAALKGRLTDCSAELEAESQIGDLQANVAIQYDTLQHDWLYVGRVHSTALGIRSVVPNEWVSSTGLHLLFDGKGFDPERMTATLSGELTDTRVRNHDLAHTTLSASLTDGKLRMEAALEDSLIGAALSWVTRLDESRHQVNLSLKNARLTQLGLLEGMDSDIVLTTRLAGEFKDLAKEEMSVRLEAKDTRCGLGSRELSLQSLVASVSSQPAPSHATSLTEVAPPAGKKSLSLECDWLTAGIEGFFDYEEVPMMVRDFSRRFLPVYYQPSISGAEVDPDDDRARLVDNTFNLNLVWNDTAGTFRLAMPAVAIANGTRLNGSYNYAESLKLVLRSDGLGLGEVYLADVGMSTNTVGEGYGLRLKMGDLSVSGMPLAHNLELDADAGNRISTVNLEWFGVEGREESRSELEFFLTSNETGNKLMVSKPGFYVMGHPWSIVCPEGILFDNSCLEAHDVRIYGLDQSLTVNTQLQGSDSDYVNLGFVDFSLGRVGELLLAQQNILVEGNLDGTVSLHSPFTRPYIEAALTVDNLAINGQSAGKVEITSNWEASESRLYVDLLSEKQFPDRVTRPVELHGSVLIDGSNDMDFLVELHRVSLETVGPMLAQVTSNIKGLVSGNLWLHGTPKDLMLNGTASVTDGLLQVDATGVTYYFQDTLQIANDTLKLHDFALHDNRANTALVNGNIVYQNPELLLDLSLATDAIMVLDNEPQGDNPYGRLFVSAQGSLTGKASYPIIAVTATTLSGSEIHFPVNNKSQAEESDFIHFTANGPKPIAKSQKPIANSQQPTAANLDLLLDLHVTPGAKLTLPMDFSGIGANVTAVGNGDIRLTMAGNSPNIIGSYEFASGSFLLSLLGLLDKNFIIEQGSSLSFPGRVENARFDIKAVYEQRVNLSSLLGSDDNLSGGSDAYAQVQNVIALSGTLQNPTVKFDIRMPNADPSTLEQINSYINLSNDQDMLNQTVSLLLLGQFSTSGSITEGVNTQGYNSGGWNMLASTMSSLVSNMIGIVDVNIKYQPGMSQSSGQLDVGISKQWDKLYFESTFGYGTRSDMESDLRNVLVGDMLVGYRLSPNFSFYASHRTNTSYYTRSEIPYKQGVGLKWTKDFTTLSDLFKK